MSEDKVSNILTLTEIYEKLAKKKDYKSALPIARKLVETRGHTKDWMAQAKCESLLGYFPEAIKSYSAIVNNDDRNSVAWTKLGGLLSILAKYDEALGCLSCASKLEPGSFETHINIATVLTNIGRHEESLDIIDQIIQIKPDFAMVWLHRGLVLKTLSRYHDALFSFEQALLIEPNHENTLLNKGLVLSSLKRNKEALTNYNLALKLNSSNSLSWLAKGLALRATSNYQEALLSFNKSIELNSINSDAWLAKGVVLCELEYYSEALTCFEKVTKTGNKNHDKLIYSAVALLALRNWKDRFKVLNLAFESLSSIKELDRQITIKIVCNLFCSLSNQSEWRSPIQALIDVYDKFCLSHHLNSGLTKSISKLVSSIFSLEKVKGWRDIWQENTINRPEFQALPGLLDIAVDYREKKGSPLIYLEYSNEKVNLFKSLLGVEKSLKPLNKSKLLFNAGLIALSGYKLLGRGFVYFFGEKPKYVPRKENMPDEFLILIEDYLPDKEFLVIPSNHESTLLLEFDEIGIEVSLPLSENEYEKELEKRISLLVQNRFNKDETNELRQMIFALRAKTLNLINGQPENSSILQDLLEEVFFENLEFFGSFLYKADRIN